MVNTSIIHKNILKKYIKPIFLIITFLFNIQVNSEENTLPVIKDNKVVEVQSVVSNVVKWHPGHYISLYPNQKEPYYFYSAMIDLRGNPGFKGVQKKYFWNKLEPSYGVYDFSEI